jgi:hypothetical protein
VRGGGDRLPDVANVELKGSGLSMVGCEMLTRGTMGRDDVVEGGVADPQL